MPQLSGRMSSRASPQHGWLRSEKGPGGLILKSLRATYLAPSLDSFNQQIEAARGTRDGAALLCAYISTFTGSGSVASPCAIDTPRWRQVSDLRMALRDPLGEFMNSPCAGRKVNAIVFSRFAFGAHSDEVDESRLLGPWASESTVDGAGAGRRPPSRADRSVSDCSGFLAGWARPGHHRRSEPWGG